MREEIFRRYKNGRDETTRGKFVVYRVRRCISKTITLRGGGRLGLPVYRVVERPVDGQYSGP